jgi:hypothetical protein
MRETRQLVWLINDNDVERLVQMISRYEIFDNQEIITDVNFIDVVLEPMDICTVK